MKQTAVELLNEQLLVTFREKQDKLIDAETFWKFKKEILVQAKTEEKIQMINFLKSVFLQDGFDYDKAYINFINRR
jgi:hypothetical protein